MTGFLGAAGEGRQQAASHGLCTLAGLVNQGDGELVPGQDGSRQWDPSLGTLLGKVCVRAYGKVLSPSPGAGSFLWEGR